MIKYILENKPEGMKKYRKKVTIQLYFSTEPFYIMTQEGRMEISPETVDDWEDGYYVAYPDDGSKPYSISPKFVRDNYEEVYV